MPEKRTHATVALVGGAGHDDRWPYWVGARTARLVLLASLLAPGLAAGAALAQPQPVPATISTPQARNGRQDHGALPTVRQPHVLLDGSNTRPGGKIGGSDHGKARQQAANRLPTVTASFSVATGWPLQTVTLSANFDDPDGDTPTFQWRQLSGPTVALSDSTAAVCTFQTTSVATYFFDVVASDGRGGSGQAFIAVPVQVDRISLASSGTDASGNLLPGGSDDPRYTVSGPGISGSTSALVLSDTGGWPANDAHSGWINFEDAVLNSLGDGTWNYRYQFDLTGYDPSTATLIGDWAVDLGASIQLNGQSTGFVNDHLGGLQNFRISSGFDPGVNTLDFAVREDWAWNGLLVRNLVLTAQRTASTATLAVALTYGKPRDLVSVGNLDLTATFSVPVVTTPTLAIDAPGTANDVAATAMTPTSTSTVWTYATTLVAGNDGLATVTIAGARDVWGHPNQPATNATFAIRSPAVLEATLAAPNRWSRGGTPVVTLSVVNTGGSTATGVSISLTFSDPRLGATALGASPVAVAAGTTATWGFAASVPLTATIAPVALTATLFYTDVLSEAASQVTTAGAATVSNCPPTAVIAPAPSVQLGTPIALDGRGSCDGPAPDRSEGETLTYHWSVVTRATGSALTAEAFSVNGLAGAYRTSIRADRKGTYRFGLVVNDGHDNSVQATVETTVVNTPPVAAFALPTTATAGTAVVLDGRGSSDADREDTISYRWVLATAPAGVSTSSVAIAGTVLSSFTPVAAGSYTIRLVVNDGAADSTPVQQSVQVQAPPGVRFAQPLNGQALAADEDWIRPGLQTTVVVTANLNVATILALSVNGTLVATAATTASSDGLQAVFSSITLPAGALTLAAEAPGGPAASIRVTVPQALPPRADVQMRPTMTSSGPRTIELDGSGSRASTISANRVTSYRWTVAGSPAGAATTASAAAVMRYEARRPGTYQFALTVTDQYSNSATAATSFVVVNVPPAAHPNLARDVNLPNLGAPAGVATTGELTLDGRVFQDANDDPLTYSWTLLAAPDLPAGATGTSHLAALTDPAGPTSALRFTALDLVTGADGRAHVRAAGSYQVRIDASDGQAATSAVVAIRAVDPCTLMPAANAGLDAFYSVQFLGGGTIARTVPDPSISPGQDNLQAFVRLDGHESADPRGLTLTYAWSPIQVPAFSQIRLSNPAAISPTFVPDTAGTYSFQLVVDNGVFPSAPSQVHVTIADGQAMNRPPIASPKVDDLARSDSRTPQDQLRSFVTGTTVLLDATGSTDPDAADRQAGLLYSWRQTAGESVALVGSAESPTADFVAARQGLYAFDLTVSDRRGASSPPLGISFLVLPASQPRPVLSLAASCWTTTMIGEDAGEGLRDGTPRSLQVMISHGRTPEVTLTATVTPAVRHRLRWRQSDGPTVLLSTTGEADQRSTRSVTSFVPTTSRVHEFEALLDLLNGMGLPTGVQLSRRIRVVVNTPTRQVPTAAVAPVTRAAPLGGSDVQRTISLDGRGSSSVTAAALGRPLLYVWQQRAGPPVSLSNPYSAVTTFVVPTFGDNVARKYQFALYVDTGEDRSEPCVLSVQQAAEAAPTTVFAGLGPASAGGCAMTPGGPDRSHWPNALPVLIVLAVLFGAGRTCRDRPPGKGLLPGNR